MMLMILPLTMPIDSMNVGVQIGDIVYYSTKQSVMHNGHNSGIEITTPGITRLGLIVSMDPGSVRVIYDETIINNTGGLPPPSNSDYIMFEKDKQVNSSSLTGYYASVELINYSRNKIELFSVGSEISESSK